MYNIIIELITDHMKALIDCVKSADLSFPHCKLLFFCTLHPNTDQTTFFIKSTNKFLDVNRVVTKNSMNNKSVVVQFDGPSDSLLSTTSTKSSLQWSSGSLKKSQAPV